MPVYAALISLSPMFDSLVLFSLSLIFLYVFWGNLLSLTLSFSLFLPSTHMLFVVVLKWHFYVWCVIVYICFSPIVTPSPWHGHKAWFIKLSEFWVPSSLFLPLPFFLSLSVSLSLSHTHAWCVYTHMHTHTHTNTNTHTTHKQTWYRHRHTHWYLYCAQFTVCEQD